MAEHRRQAWGTTFMKVAVGVLAILLLIGSVAYYRTQVDIRSALLSGSKVSLSFAGGSSFGIEANQLERINGPLLRMVNGESEVAVGARILVRRDNQDCESLLKRSETSANALVMGCSHVYWSGDGLVISLVPLKPTELGVLWTFQTIP